jgi:glycosyltransferase involved in cell wall biosynthesis
MHKNLARVIEAIKGMNCLLDIVGRIPAEIRQKIELYKINFRESVNISDKQLAVKYAESDVLLFPTIFEGFGLPIIEAQKSGRPVVTSNFNPMKEVAGEGACLVDPFDIQSIRKGLCRVIEDTAYRQLIVRNGFENINRFLPEKIALQYEQQYALIASLSNSRS